MTNPQTTNRLKSSDLARLAKVNLESLRYYEREGLLPTPARTASGYRQYDQADVKRVRFIKKTQALGFSLKEIRELLALRQNTHTNAADIRQVTLQKLHDIDNRVAELQRIRQALEQLISCCHGEGPTRDCPILHYLDDD
jgi:MerR family transcriptional regulator, copper efflux regulator